MSGLMEGRRALVTGAGSGIGAATARLMAREGARVAVGYHNDRDGAEQVAASLQGEGHVAVRAKIDDAGSLAAAVAEIGSAFRHLDVLVNSAGSTVRVPPGDLDALGDEVFDEICRVNLRSPFAVIRAFRPLLEAAPEGAVVVSIGSLAGQTGVGSNLAYAASKAGLVALSKGLARVLGPGIRILTVSPGGVDTGFVTGRDPAAAARAAEATPLRRVTQPEDVARTVLACAALMPGATGIDIVVDEGRHLVGWPLPGR